MYELYDDCRFENCALTKVNFDGAVFKHTTFIGELNEVQFWRISPMFGRGDENKMEGCDLSRADVTWTQFFDISLDPAIFGDNPDLIILWNGPEDYKKWFAEFTDGRPAEVLRDGMLCAGAPTVASRTFLRECEFSEAEIRRLAEIGARRR